MKGKGKGKESAEDKDCPLHFPELTPLDPDKHCPKYASIIQGRECGGGITRLLDLEILQHELETLLFSVTKRKEELEKEIEILIQWQEKMDKKLQETCGKRSSSSEGNTTKKCKDGSGRPKAKSAQESDSADSPSEACRVLRTDAPNRFWASLEPYFADITPDHIKFLEDWVRVHDDDEDYFKIPPIGKHYSYEWGSKDIQEEQKEGVKATEKKKGLSNNCSLNFADPDKILKKAEKESDSEDSLPLGPLAQRLVSCLIEEKVMPSLEDMIDTTKDITECPVSPHSKGNFITSLNISDSMTLEKRIRRELEEAGILEPDETDLEISDDPVLAELKEVQSSLRVVTEYNLSQKQRLLKLAKEEMARQEIMKKLQYLDSDIIDVYRRKQKKKTPSKKEKEQTVAKLKERENLVQELESIGNFSL